MEITYKSNTLNANEDKNKINMERNELNMRYEHNKEKAN